MGAYKTEIDSFMEMGITAMIIGVILGLMVAATNKILG